MKAEARAGPCLRTQASWLFSALSCRLPTCLCSDPRLTPLLLPNTPTHPLPMFPFASQTPPNPTLRQIEIVSHQAACPRPQCAAMYDVLSTQCTLLPHPPPARLHVQRRGPPKDSILGYASPSQKHVRAFQTFLPPFPRCVPSPRVPPHAPTGMT